MDSYPLTLLPCRCPTALIADNNDQRAMETPLFVEKAVSADDEATKISNRLHDLDEDIRQILVQRVPLLCRLNHIQRIFPDEILCTIFECTSTTDKNDNRLLSPLILGAICSRWRQIVWNSPSLWRTIGTIPNLRRPVRPSDVELLRLHFQNSGVLSVNLKLRLDGLPPGRTTEELLKVFMDNSAKIKLLVLSSTNSLKTWTKLATAVDGCDFDNLHSLSFVGRKPIRYLFPQLFFHAPHMRSVSFDGLYLPVWQFPLNFVQVLHLKNIAINQCFDLLTHSLALQELYCSGTEDEERPTIPHRGILTLHHLEVFDTNFGPSFTPWAAFFFTHFRFPKLRKLVWGTPSCLSLELRDATWGPFFSAMNSVADFTYQSQEYSKRELSGMLRALGPSVRRIRIPSPAAQSKWQSALNAIQLSMGRIPGCISMLHIKVFFPQQNPIFKQNPEEIKEQLRGAGLEIDIIGF